MHVKLLRDIITSTVGQNATAIADLLYGKKNVNEFVIAKKLKLTINQTRNILYKLSDEGLVNFIRKKDSKKGGWYTYFWTLNIERSLSKFKEKLEKDIEHLEQGITVKKNTRFFVCNNCHIEMNEEQALLHDYLCPECGELLQLKNSTVEIAELQRQIGKIKEVLVGVTEELDTILAEEAKKRDRKMKAEQRKVLAERATRRKQREREKKRLETAKKRKAAHRKKVKKARHAKKKKNKRKNKKKSKSKHYKAKKAGKKRR